MLIFSFSEQLRASMRAHNSARCADHPYRRAWAKITSSKVTTAYPACHTLFLTGILPCINRPYSASPRESIFKSGQLKNNSLDSARQSWSRGPRLVGRYMAGLSSFIAIRVRQGFSHKSSWHWVTWHWRASIVHSYSGGPVQHVAPGLSLGLR